MSDKSSNQRPIGFFSSRNVRILGFLICIIFIIKWSISSPYHVPTSSMEPTIKVGDRIFAWKLAYGLTLPFMTTPLIKWSQISRGDIVIFRFPTDPNLEYIKRVIGLPGDKIEIIEHRVLINDEPIQQTMLAETVVNNTHQDRFRAPQSLLLEKNGPLEYRILTNSTKEIDRRIDDRQTYIVPNDAVFVMGDNRSYSSDSRDWGAVPVDHIYGRATFVIWSFQNRPDQTGHMRWDRFFFWL